MNQNSFQHLEQKYIFVEPLKDMILEWLEHSCVRDRSFESQTVSSIYFDTPSLSLYDEKRNGEYLKSKVRLRWYADHQTMGAPVACYFEIKRKYGPVCKKDRLELEIPSGILADDPFSDEEILDLPNRAHELGYLPPGILVPTLLIRYHRRRFIEPFSGSRISVDTDIHCAGANKAYLPALAPVYLGTGVLEVKGRQREILPSLIPIRMHITKAAFSKYAQCLEQLMQPLQRRM